MGWLKEGRRKVKFLSSCVCICFCPTSPLYLPSFCFVFLSSSLSVGSLSSELPRRPSSWLLRRRREEETRRPLARPHRCKRPTDTDDETTPHAHARGGARHERDARGRARQPIPHRSPPGVTAERHADAPAASGGGGVPAAAAPRATAAAVSAGTAAADDDGHAAAALAAAPSSRRHVDAVLTSSPAAAVAAAFRSRAPSAARAAHQHRTAKATSHDCTQLDDGWRCPVAEDVS